MTSLSGIIQEHTKFFHVFDHFSYTIASNLTLSSQKQATSSFVIGIDNETFEGNFREQSPLNRCELARQLDAIYDREPTLVVVDLDLSPTIASIKEGIGSADAICQERLNRRIIEAHSTKTVLLNPFVASTREINDTRESWKREMQAAGILFGDGSLPVHIGTVQSQYLHQQTLAARAEAVYRAKYLDARQSGPASGLAQAGLDAGNPDASLPALAGSEDQSVLDSETKNLNFRAFGEQTQSLHWRDFESGNGVPDMRGGVVFYGANYGQDDQFLTPLDSLYGVNIHAAAFESLRAPVDRVAGWRAVCLDVLIGLVFGVFITWAWGGYFKSKLAMGADPHVAARERALAARFLVYLLVGFIGASVALSMVAGVLMAHLGIWIMPVPIMIGMAFDSFVTGSVDAAVDATKGEFNIEESGRSYWDCLSKGVSWAFWLLVVYYGMTVTLSN